MTMLLRAEAPVYGGYSISRDDGVVFVKGAIPGEMVEVSVDEKKRDYTLTSVKEVLEPSPYRVEPPCPYFGLCGGCQIQYVSYEKQVSMKNEVLSDCLRRIGRLEKELEPPIAGRPFGYRIRGQFKVSRDGKTGFFREGTREAVDIKRCLLLTDGLNDSYSKIRETGISGAKEIHVTHGEETFVLVKGVEYDEGISEALEKIGVSGVCFDDGSYRGKGFMSLPLLGLTYTASPWSFLQSNWALSVKMAETVKEGLSPMGSKRVLDVYAGAGNFSLPLHEDASEIVAVEENPHSVKDGERNVSINNIENYGFITARAEKAKLKGRFDIVILDPPRPGLSSSVAEMLLRMRPERVVYISCNPATLARDLRKLQEVFLLDSIRMVDLFPNTYHIESVAFLSLRA